MNIKIMNKKPTTSDEEIRLHMDFDGLLKKKALLTSSRTIAIRWSLLAAGVAVVSFCTWLVWPSDTTTVVPAGLPAHNPSVSNPANPEKKPGQHALRETKAEKKNKNESVSPVINNQPVPKEKSSATATASTYVEAEPVAGFPSFYEYLNSNIIYPVAMLKDSVQGVESVSFVIDETGTAGQITILHSLGKNFDEEAFRLLGQMPAWKPATLNGKSVASRISLPLTFTIRKTKK
jgi:hypothetical protein